MSDPIKPLINGYGPVIWRTMLLLLIGIVGFIGTRIYDAIEALPHTYVRIERYVCDQQTLQKQLERIEATQGRTEDKLDHILLRGESKDDSN